MSGATCRMQGIPLSALRQGFQLQGLAVLRGMGTDSKWVRVRLFLPIELPEEGHQALQQDPRREP